MTKDQVPSLLKTFSETVVRQEGHAPEPRTWAPGVGDSVRLYNNLEDQSLETFFGRLNEQHVLVHAEHVPREIKGRTYHTCKYVFVHKDDPDVHCDMRFAPRRPAIQTEMQTLLVWGLSWNIRNFYDNQLFDTEGQPVEGCSRWEINLNQPKEVNSAEKKKYLIFPT